VAVWGDNGTYTTIYASEFGPPPPTDFRGRVVQNEFLTQTDVIHHLHWRPSMSDTVDSYKLSRNGQLIALIPATHQLEYNDHNRLHTDTYSLTALDEGFESQTVVTVVPH
jgi:hypothetical protein